MARITVEDCLERVDNRFGLIHLAANRVRQLRKGAEPLVVCKNRDTVVALREIAAGKVFRQEHESAKSPSETPSDIILDMLAEEPESKDVDSGESASKSDAAQKVNHEQTRCTTKFWVFPEPLNPSKSNRLIESWPSSIIRIEIPVTRKLRKNSRRPRKPMACLRMLRKDRFMIVSGMKVWQGPDSRDSAVSKIFFSNFGDIFEGIFGFGGGGRNRARQGKSLRYDLELTLEEAFHGKEVEIVFHRLENCPSCGGSGAKPGTQPRTCPTCNGRGQVIRSQGFFQVSSTCPSCHGQGEIISDPCPECGGGGENKGPKKSFRSKFPRASIRVLNSDCGGKANPAKMGGPGATCLWLVHVKDHDFFTREDDNLICEIPISFVSGNPGRSFEHPHSG